MTMLMRMRPISKSPWSIIINLYCFKKKNHYQFIIIVNSSFCCAPQGLGRLQLSVVGPSGIYMDQQTSPRSFLSLSKRSLHSGAPLSIAASSMLASIFFFFSFLIYQKGFLFLGENSLLSKTPHHVLLGSALVSTN